MRFFIPITAGLLVFIMTCTQTAAQVGPPKPRDTTITGPQTFAMIMGISSYKYVRPLNYADKDAELFRDFLKYHGGGKLPDENFYCLLNYQAMSSTFFTNVFKLM